MKTLFVLRHAKSSWENPDSSDFDRPLNKQGLNEVLQMGKIIFEHQFQPEIIISSPAKRAKQTTILIKEAAQIEKKIEFDERVYEASPLRLFQVVSEIAENKKSMMLVGHNPGLEGLIKILTGGIQPMSTAALAVIKLNTEKWSEISANCGELETLIAPSVDLESPDAS
jgi:phosphohistidine phosphatase